MLLVVRSIIKVPLSCHMIIFIKHIILFLQQRELVYLLWIMNRLLQIVVPFLTWKPIHFDNSLLFRLIWIVSHILIYIIYSTWHWEYYQAVEEGGSNTYSLWSCQCGELDTVCSWFCLYWNCLTDSFWCNTTEGREYYSSSYCQSTSIIAVVYSFIEIVVINTLTY